MDFYFDHPGSSTVHSIVRNGKADYAGLKAGDVILTVDDVQFSHWFAPQIGKTHIVMVERRGESLSLPIPAVRLVQMNYLPLFSAIITALTFWGIGTLLFLRRFWHPEIRLLFLIFQAVAVVIVFPLSFQAPWDVPESGLLFSKVSVCLLSPLFLNFTVTYPVKLGNPWKRWVGLFLLYGSIPIILWSWIREEARDSLPVILYISLVFALAVSFLVYSYQYRATPEGRRRTRVIVFCSLAAITFPILLYLLPKAMGSSLVLPEWVAGLFLTLAPIGYLFATLHYNLYGIDRLINRTLVYAVLSFGIFIIYVVPYIFLYQYLPDDLFTRLGIIFSLTIWIGWTFDWLRSRAQKLVDHFVYGGWYDFPVVVETISDALARSNTRSKVNDVLTIQVPKLMRLTNSNLWINNSNFAIPSLPPLKAAFRYKFQVETPAQWTVDSHPDGDDLSEVDLRILHTIAQQAEIALKNALTIETLQSQLAEIKTSREILAHTQRQLLRSREEERSRLARDLHDSPIQSLVGMNIQMGLLLNQKSLDATLANSLTEMRSEVRQLSDELRQVCADLRPPMLDTLGLSSAIRSLASEWSEQTGIITQLNLCPDSVLKSLPGEITVNIYRVAQEALSNISKHAKAKNVRLSISSTENQIIMEIEDDGIGFEAPDTLHGFTAQSHFGLAGMRERIDLIGGEWSLRSSPGKGTTVRVVLSANENHQ